MKHLLVLLLAFSLISSCKNDKNKNVRDRDSDRRERDDYRSADKEDDNSKSADYKDSEAWSAADVKKFNKDCLSEVANNNEEFADKFCPCFLDKMQNKFSSYSEMELKSTEAQGKTAAEDCIETLGLSKSNVNTNENSGGNWSSSDQKEFVSTCVSSAVDGGMQRNVAQNYCSCMLGKLEQLYPDSKDAVGMDNTEMERLAKKCLIQN
jgi:hypothetical protein